MSIQRIGAALARIVTTSVLICGQGECPAPGWGAYRGSRMGCQQLPALLNISQAFCNSGRSMPNL